MLKTRSRIVLLALCLAPLAGCGVPEARKLAIAEATRIHEQMNAAQYMDIYNAASQEFRQAATPEQWITVSNDLRKRCGMLKSSQPNNKDESAPVLLVDSGGYMVILTYVSEYELGTVDETLRFAVKDGQARLLGYHADSPMLRQ